MQSVLLSAICVAMFSVSSFTGEVSANDFSPISQKLESVFSMSDELQEGLAVDPLVSAESGTDLDCQEILPSGGWTSFPLACRRFVGQLQVAMDSDFHDVIMMIAIEQRGHLKRDPSGKIGYYFSLKLGKLQMRPQIVVWNDRSYQIGKKIRGLCNSETDSSVVCQAAFHGILGRIVGGYVETYYGPGITQINLKSANSQEGHSPLLHWRAALTEVK